MADKKYRKVTETLTKIAKDRDGNIKGQGTMTAYSEDKKGHDECLKAEGYADLMWLRNRQAESQVLNLHRREADEITIINRETKETRSKLDDNSKADMDKELKAVKEKYTARLARNAFKDTLRGRSNKEIETALSDYDKEPTA